jgi:NAD(P)-dependent dehydrogenase (short-subunit alcohol dehydrogenase family)
VSLYPDLAGKVVLVTGGAGVLGSAFCRAFVEQGSKVIITDVDLPAATTQANQLPTHDVLPLHMDVSQPDSVNDAFQKMTSRYQTIDIVINNAATKTAHLQEFFADDVDFSPTTWREVMSTNLDGMFFVAQAAGRHMLTQRRGSIVQIASIYGIVGPDQRIYAGSNYLGHQISSPAVYSASKAGVLGLTRHLATAWADRGVRVNSVTPGGVESGQNNTFTEKYSHRVPLQRMATPNDILGAVLFLASDSSSYITGHNLVVDGGLTAW